MVSFLLIFSANSARFTNRGEKKAKAYGHTIRNPTSMGRALIPAPLMTRHKKNS